MDWIKKISIPLFVHLILLLSLGCEPEAERPAQESELELSFSTDTLFFDTLFTETKSITKRLKVYNHSSGAISIDQLFLEKRETSPFTLYVNGQRGKSFQNVQVLGNDSLLVLVEATIDRTDTNLPFIVEDHLIISNGTTYSTPLIAWGQDAVFLKDSVLPCEMTFTADKPYVLFGSVLVDSLCTLTIEPGTRIYNNFNSILYVKGSLKIAGSKENRVLITNARLDENYRNAPGQWRGIYILEGSVDNSIRFADIRNADVGIRIGSPDEDEAFELEVGHTRIENITTAGILSYTSDVFIYNSLINNCGMSSFAGVAGGNYRLWNNTFANYSFDFFREDATLILSDNVVLGDNSLLVDNLNAEVINNIIWGSLTEEVIISESNEADDINILFRNNIIRTSSDSLTSKNLVNTDPLFLEPSKYNYKIDPTSAAIDAGMDLKDITTDLLSNPRKNTIDIGAFEIQ